MPGRPMKTVLAVNRKEGEQTNHSSLTTVVFMERGMVQTLSASKFQFDFAKSSPSADHLGEADEDTMAISWDEYPNYVLILKSTNDGLLLVPSAITMISN